MMHRRKFVRMSFVAALTVAFVALLTPHAAHAQNVSKTAMAGPYSVNLKILPAEGFRGEHAPMKRDSGAMPVTLNSPVHPNHHMVVFIKKDGQPVEHAHVKIWYRQNMGNKSMMNGEHGMGKKDGMMEWVKLPVVRMQVRGKGAATTHFGNNVRLNDGNYEVKVKVDGKTAMFYFSLK